MSTVISQEVLDITTDEIITYTADFTLQLYGDTIASVSANDETTTLGLVTGAASVNSGSTVSVDGRTIAISKCCQFSVDATGATAGDAIVRVIVVTAGGNTRSLDCRFTVIT